LQPAQAYETPPDGMVQQCQIRADDTAIECHQNTERHNPNPAALKRDVPTPPALAIKLPRPRLKVGNLVEAGDQNTQR